MTNGVIPNPPVRELPGETWEHHRLYENVREAISALFIYFRTETHISGVMATDLHTLNTVLGATIEEQVVSALNLLRTTWDPDDLYALYGFVRQAQTFPDVLLRRASDGHIILGIELKGWYLLTKENEPSLRFVVTPDACAVQDLIVVVPWVLNNVISGSPILYEPFIESAKYAASYRNYHWQHLRQTTLDRGITIAAGIRPYPLKSDRISDVPRSDRGKNFGRLARTGMMDAYRDGLGDVPLCGIKTKCWRQFLKTFQESTTDIQARDALERLKERIQQETAVVTERNQAILTILEELENLIDT